MLLGASLVCGLAARGEEPPPIIQPGAPGEPGRRLSAEEASDLAGILFTQADVKFMQGMIRHHAQALAMTALVEARSESEDMRVLAQRIELSQRDEIEMMEEWLRSNGQEVEVVASGAHYGHDEALMPGMLTAEEMSRLEAARGVEFDRLFLELMIAHHRGALVMVEDLLSNEGAAQESTVFAFTSDVTADQSMEIDRMAAMLTGLSTDPRVGLDSGFRDAGEAALHLELVASLPKPAGFFAPDSPAGLPIPPEKKDEETDEDPYQASEAAAEPDGEEAKEPVKGVTEEMEKRKES
ncbi:MAG TPA: DUF305 domain-containing protein, partial [Thermoanaerobaculia bacterium]|nr:DUF305 domain-containing protein [Thermoanaerobaculia bacterium]